MKLLVLGRYDQLGASSRVRMYQFLPYLRARGVDVTSSPLLSDAYLEALYARRRPDPLEVGGAYLSRVRLLARARRYDLLWIEKELFPWLPDLGERLLPGGGVPYVVDYDDAIFHRYDQHGSALVRGLLGTKIDAVMRRATAVTAGNAYLMERAGRAGARRVEWVPTVVDLERYPMRARPADAPFTVGWIGSPATQHYLEPLAPLLARLREEHGARVVLIGATSAALAATGAELVPWSEASEAERLGDIDVGIMPLPDAPWERGKCGYKLIQYMASGRPVVASPVGVNTALVEPGATGFLADSPEDWRSALERLARDRALGARLGAAGRAKVESAYSVQAVAPRLLELFRDVVAGGHGRCAAS